MGRKAIDLTGQKFHRLTVLERDFSKKSSTGAYWICECECGRKTSVLAQNLKNNKIKSCGCLAKELTSQRSLKDEVGNRYGKLTIIKKDESRKTIDGKVCWICQCDCGNIISTDGGTLRKGNVNSCGCIKSKGELKISQILRENNINFEREKTFESCRFPDTKRLARFDFYLPDFNILIEYDGIQHFKDLNFYRPLEYYQKHDLFKNEWCEKNNIKLIRIPYYKLKEIKLEDLL